MKPITLRMLLIRLATVKQDFEKRGVKTDEVTIYANVNGKLIKLCTENFKVDNDGDLIINTDGL